MWDVLHNHAIQKFAAKRLWHRRRSHGFRIGGNTTVCIRYKSANIERSRLKHKGSRAHLLGDGVGHFLCFRSAKIMRKNWVSRMTNLETGRELPSASYVSSHPPYALAPVHTLQKNDGEVAGRERGETHIPQVPLELLTVDIPTSTAFFRLPCIFLFTFSRRWTGMPIPLRPRLVFQRCWQGMWGVWVRGFWC